MGVPRGWRRLPVTPVLRLAEGAAIVAGEIVQLLGERIASPVPLPPGAPPLDAMAMALIETEELRTWKRPLAVTHERVRPFVLRDATGSALVRFDREPDELELRFHRPFVPGGEGRRAVLVRAVSSGERVVVVGTSRFLADAQAAVQGPGGGYRSSSLVPTLFAHLVFDEAAWAAVAAWRDLPFLRKLSVIMRNR